MEEPMKRKSRSSLLVLFVMLCSLVLLSANTETAHAKNKKASKKVTVKKVTVCGPVSAKTAYVAKGKTIKLTTKVSVKPNKKANKAVAYKTSNKKVATVSKKGVVKGKKTGTAKITVTSKKNKKKKASIKIKVVTPIKSVTFSQKAIALEKGKTEALKVTYKPAKKVYKKLVYTTSNAAVAKVSSTGVVTGVGGGTAVITAKALDGTNKKAKCNVSVYGIGYQQSDTIIYTMDKYYECSENMLSIGAYYAGNSVTTYYKDDEFSKVTCGALPKGITSELSKDGETLCFKRDKLDIEFKDVKVQVTVHTKKGRKIISVVHLSTEYRDKIVYNDKTEYYFPMGKSIQFRGYFTADYRDEYKVELLSGSRMLEFSGYSGGSFYLSGKVTTTQPTKYVIRCTSVSDPKKTATTTITVTGYKTSELIGNIYGRGNIPVCTNSYVELICISNPKYSFVEENNAGNDGSYCIGAKAGERYLLKTIVMGESYFEYITMPPVGKELKYDLKTTFAEVNLEVPAGYKFTNNKRWYEVGGKDRAMGFCSGSKIYVKDGTYSIYGFAWDNDFEQNGAYRYMVQDLIRADFTVAGESRISVKTKVWVRHDPIPINEGIPSLVKCEDSSLQRYSFTPQVTTTYTFSSSAAPGYEELKWFGMIYTADGKYVGADSWTTQNNYFTITTTLEAGKTYYLFVGPGKVMLPGDAPKYCSVTISQ